MKGLYLDQWRTMQFTAEVDNAFTYASANGYTDIFAHCGVVDRTPNLAHNISRAATKATALKRHAFMQTLWLWRNQNALSNVFDKGMLMRDEGHTYLNPLVKASQDYLVNKAVEIVRDNVVDGLQLSRLYYPMTGIGNNEQALTDIIGRISTECRKIRPLKISVDTYAFGEGLDYVQSKMHNDWRLWLKEGHIDNIAPLMFQVGEDVFDRWVDIMSVYPTWYVIGKSKDNDLVKRIAKCKDYIFWSYAQRGNLGN